MRKESIYAYPAVFRKEKNGLFSVDFPDIEGCYTSGDDLLHALIMASDVLALMIYTNYEEKDIEAPESTPIEEIKLGTNEFASYVVCDTKSYRWKHKNDEICYGDAPEGIKVTEVFYIRNGLLLVTFSNNETKVFDTACLKGPVFEALSDPEVVSHPVLNEMGVITWKNGEINVAPEYVYANSTSDVPEGKGSFFADVMISLKEAIAYEKGHGTAHIRMYEYDDKAGSKLVLDMRGTKAEVEAQKKLRYYMNLPYKLEIIPDPVEGGFVASYPELPGCLTIGETMESVIANAIDAKREWIGAALEDGFDIPEPTDLTKQD